MSIFVDILWLVFGLVALYFGAEWLVNSAAKISLKFGISPLVVGLTVVAFGTSAPELFVCVKFNSTGESDMALGNVVGSNICNIGMVLGISAFICNLFVKKSLLKRDMSMLVGASILFSLFLIDGQVSRLEGSILFVAIVLYTIFRLRVSHKTQMEAATEIESEIGSPGDTVKDPVWKLAALVLAGLVVLYIGSEALETGGTSLATRLGVPGAIISLTVIAFSTSVPELATSIVASIKKEGDLITGNIVGSCLFNLLCVIGLTALVKPMSVSHIEMVDLFVMLSFTILLIPMMLSRFQISRVEGSILLIGYVWYCVYLWMERISPA